ncbi:MAG: HD domain-containing protein [Chloroflexi bacterium]|nr:HD domain-containing protein [Chloroflexota bacterium]
MIATKNISTHKTLSGLLAHQPAELVRHSQNVADLSSALAALLGCPSDEIDKIYIGSLLHDIGKQFLPASILEKREKFTDREFGLVQMHTWKGYTYLNNFIADPAILHTVLYHHERWNGTGYPYHLAQNQIPLSARICAIADVWDALISDRCYRRALNMTQALDLIWTGAGSLFDPKIAAGFVSLIAEGYKVGLVANKNEDELIVPNIWHDKDAELGSISLARSNKR